MINFFKKHPVNVVLKLYAIDVPMARRESILNAIILTLKTNFNQLPKNYVIHGPYGVRKGGSILYKTFVKKLAEKGHEKYYAVDGQTENSHGFHFSYSSVKPVFELTIWHREGKHDLNNFLLVKSLVDQIDVKYGYIFNLPSNYLLPNESKLTKGLLGYGSEPNKEYQSWSKKMELIEQGVIRKVFAVNVINDKQLKNFDKQKFYFDDLPRDLKYVHAKDD